MAFLRWSCFFSSAFHSHQSLQLLLLCGRSLRKQSTFNHSSVGLQRRRKSLLLLLIVLCHDLEKRYLCLKAGCELKKTYKMPCTAYWAAMCQWTVLLLLLE